MRASQMGIVTLREDPADAEIVSHKLLMRSGFIYKSGSGLYLYGPLLQRTLGKIRSIIAEEISTAGGLEITMPIMQEQGLWERSGRWAGFQQTKTMLTVTDRGGQSFGLAPTAEEVVTDYAGQLVNSYKQLPVCYFQQHTKFRDEIRPRFGLMRVKEFIMMDAYSFHADEDSLDVTYRAMSEAYHRIFERCGLKAFAVEADTGAIGGSASHEFMIDAAVGEDAILIAREQGYAANVERAQSVIPAASAWESAPAESTAVATPGTKSIAEVVEYLQANGYADITASRTLKAVLMVAISSEQEYGIAAFVRGDRQVNDVKLLNAACAACGAEILELRPMNDDEVRTATGCQPGFAGPTAGLTVGAIIIDESLKGMGPVACGANIVDQHLVGFDIERDAQGDYTWADIHLAEAGDLDPSGKEALTERRGIEAGHIFKLGTKYSEAMDATFTNKSGKLQPFIMGCYGIGTSRLAAAAVEQYHDKNGMKWPVPIAPYHCVIVAMRSKEHDTNAVAQDLYDQLKAKGVEVVIDDRDMGPGPKFKDWDLIGLPYRIVVGRGLADNNVEFKDRNADAAEDVAVDVVVEKVAGLVAAAL